jgi:hypothetical protein
MGENNRIKIPVEVYEEITEGSPKETGEDLLYDWIKDHPNQNALLLEEDVDRMLVQRVVYEGYAHDLKDDELEQLGRDPFLIAYALVNIDGRCVVTTEVRFSYRLETSNSVISFLFIPFF